jgi:hypothetical protein
MQGKDLDGYIATFKHLAKKAGYTSDAEGTIQLFCPWSAERTHKCNYVPRQPAKHHGRMDYGRINQKAEVCTPPGFYQPTIHEISMGSAYRG